MVGTIIIGLVLAVLIVTAIVVLIKNKKKGKTSCGYSCAGCPMAGKCHDYHAQK